MMGIALWITGYFAVGFVAVVVGVCCDLYPKNDPAFIPLTIFCWPVVGLVRLISDIGRLAEKLGERCREARMRRREKAS